MENEEIVNCGKLRNEKYRNMQENPFKFGTIVDSQFFTDRKKELQYIKNIMESHNHFAWIPIPLGVGGNAGFL